MTKVDRTVGRIVASGVLGNSTRREALLRYLIDKELSGQGDALKAFSIAVDVLDRDVSFDPGTDSIVRSEIGRLRDALRLYNAEHADDDDVLIEIPKGTYRPSFSALEPAPAQHASWAWRPTVMGGLAIVCVLVAAAVFLVREDLQKTETPVAQQPYSDLPVEVIRIAVPPPKIQGQHEKLDLIALGLRAELMMDLSAYPWLSIVAPVDGFDGIEPHEIDYVLLGEMYWDTGALQTQTKLVTYPDEQLIWTDVQTTDLEAAALREGIVGISNSITFKLASRRGIAPELTKAKNRYASPENLEAYLCYLGMHSYLDDPTEAEHLELRTCLLDAVRHFPTFGDAWAALGLVYIDEARFGSNARAGSDPWKDAAAAIEKALKYTPLRMPSLNIALVYHAEAPAKDTFQFDHIAGLLLNVFPNHPTTLYNVGSRKAEFLGRWEEGQQLVDRAIELTPDPPSAFYLTAAYRTAMIGTDAEALASVTPLTSSTSISELLLNYLAAARNNMPDSQTYFREALRRSVVGEELDLEALIRGRGYDRQLESALLSHLESARQAEASQ